MTFFPLSMNKLTASLLLPLLGCTAIQALAQTSSSVPELMSYQGRLSTASGSLLGSGTPVNRLMHLRLFNVPTGGAPVWTEQQYANIYEGQFTLLLGNGADVPPAPRPLLSQVFAQAGENLYLEITVDSSGDNVITGADATITPRQRILSTGYAFRARSATSISTGGDLRFLSSENATASDYGLGLYNTERPFGNVAVDGPVLFGQTGGGLGLSTGSGTPTQTTALSWLGNGNVIIGAAPMPLPTERLYVDGNIKVTGGLALGGGLRTDGTLTVANGITAGSVTSAGSITGTEIRGTELHVRATGSATDLASIDANGALSLTKGGTLNGPAGNVLNVDSVGSITIKDLTVTGSSILPGGITFAAIPVLRATQRLVLGGATGWNTGTTENAPTAGANATTGMRLVLNGTDVSTDLVGFGLSANNILYSVAPASTITRWYGGTETVMSLDNSTGALTARGALITNSRAQLQLVGTDKAGLEWSVDSPTSTYNLRLTNENSGTANLAWLNKSTSAETKFMTFKRTITDAQLRDRREVASVPDTNDDPVPDMGYVGINVSNPKAPLHVKAQDYKLPDSGEGPFYVFTGSTPNHGVFLGSNGGNVNWGNHNNTDGDGRTLRYDRLAGIFDGELLTRRLWLGSGLNTASDARAKEVLGLSDSSEDLARLMKLQVTDYHWIDRSLDGHRLHKRLLAQEVKKVFPQATNILPTARAIPNVYALAKTLEHDVKQGLLTITTAQAHGLQAGDLVDLIADTTALEETKVKAVIDANRFVIESQSKPQALFVYGKYVKDFHTVDYDAISMLNVSANQELKREQDALEKENAELVDQLAAQEAELAALEAKQARTLNRLNGLEVRIQKHVKTTTKGSEGAAVKSARLTF